MMKKLIVLSLVAMLMLGFTGCKKKTFHCDGCGKEVYSSADMDESWIIYCEDCEPEFDWE